MGVIERLEAGMDRIEALKILVEQTGIERLELDQRMGVSHDTISSWLRRGAKTIKFSEGSLEKLLTLNGVTGPEEIARGIDAIDPSPLTIITKIENGQQQNEAYEERKD